MAAEIPILTNDQADAAAAGMTNDEFDAFHAGMTNDEADAFWSGAANGTLGTDSLGRG